MENLSRYEIFANLLMQGLESRYINSINFSDKFLTDINLIKEKLMQYSDNFFLGYELKEIIKYSDENNFFERYFCDDGDKLILINLNWFFHPLFRIFRNKFPIRIFNCFFFFQIIERTTIIVISIILTFMIFTMRAMNFTLTFQVKFICTIKFTTTSCRFYNNF
jgi:hypothetical protein